MLVFETPIMENCHKGIIHLKHIEEEISLKIQSNLKNCNNNCQNKPIQNIANKPIPLLFLLPLNLSPTTEHNLHQLQIDRGQWQVDQTGDDICNGKTQNQQKVRYLEEDYRIGDAE